MPDIVENLEVLLEPYKDPKYEQDLKELQDIKTKQAKTPQEANQIASELDRYFIREKHKALMRLAKRAKLLPIKSAGVNSDV